MQAVAEQGAEADHRRLVPGALVAPHEARRLALAEHPREVAGGVVDSPQLFVEGARAVERVVPEGAMRVRPAGSEREESVAGWGVFADHGEVERRLVGDGLGQVGALQREG